MSTDDLTVDDDRNIVRIVVTAAAADDDMLHNCRLAPFAFGSIVVDE